MAVSDVKGLTAPIKEGKLNYKVSEETTSTVKRGSQELGKDAFLQLLVCQMQNQDPLDPSTDTEFVAQLAQFSQLEQLQNIGTETEKSQAFSLVGKYVVFKCEDAAGNVTYPEGVVDYVSMAGKNVSISVGGNLYNYDELYTVVDDQYQLSQNIPSISQAYNFMYNAMDPEDMHFKVDFGKQDQRASEIALVVGGQQIDGQYLSYRDNEVTVAKEAFANFENGEYPVSVIFNNQIYTTVNDKLLVTVVNKAV